jgi:hypothetical protein
MSDFIDRRNQQLVGFREADSELHDLAALGLFVHSDSGFHLTALGAMAGRHILVAIGAYARERKLPHHVFDDIGACLVDAEESLPGVDAIGTCRFCSAPICASSDHWVHFSSGAQGCPDGRSVASP